MNKTVYIIIPIYNSEKYLSKCLDSVFNQTYKTIKVICVNDGSTDDSPSLLSRYKSDNNLVIINQDNLGVSAARNTGLDALDYQEDAYLTFIDADDWVDCDYIKTLVNMIEKNKVDIVCSSFLYAKDNIAKPFKHIEEEGVYSSLLATELLLKDETIQSHSCSKLYKLYLWKSFRYNIELSYMEDQDIIYKIFYQSKRVFITNYAGYYYYQNNNNATTKSAVDNKKIISGLKGYYSPCLYQYNDKDKNLLKAASQYALSYAYLTLIPYYKKSKNDKDSIFINEIKSYIKSNRLIQKYHPVCKNSIIKRKMYILCPFMYPISVKIAKAIRTVIVKFR